MNIGVKRLPHSEGLELPKKMTLGSSGADLRAAHLVYQPIKLGPLERAVVPTGLIFDIPDGYEIQVRPRSGLAAKQGLTVLNTPGTVDADYVGEVKVILVTLSNDDQVVKRGERIAQAVVAEVPDITYTEVDEVKTTERGDGAFGHTGKE